MGLRPVFSDIELSIEGHPETEELLRSLDGFDAGFADFLGDLRGAGELYFVVYPSVPSDIEAALLEEGVHFDNHFFANRASGPLQ